MRTAILALPTSLAFLALSPLFAVITVAMSKAAFSTGISPVFLSERFAALVFDGITIAAALFAVSIVSLIAQELDR